MRGRIQRACKPVNEPLALSATADGAQRAWWGRFIACSEPDSGTEVTVMYVTSKVADLKLYGNSFLANLCQQRPNACFRASEARGYRSRTAPGGEPPKPIDVGLETRI